MTCEVIARRGKSITHWALIRFAHSVNPMKKPYLALAALLGFSAYTAFTMWTADQSLVAFGLGLMASPDTAQVVIDLYLMAALACVWMYRDARSRGRSLAAVLPYLLVTAVFVCIGPLLYIVVNGFSRAPAKTPA